MAGSDQDWLREMSRYLQVCAPLVLLSVVAACSSAEAPSVESATAVSAAQPTATNPPTPTASPTPGVTPVPLVPEFEHIVIVVFENKEFGTVIGNARMPYFNQLADDHTLLAGHYAVTHPSLPNYLALISGETFGLDFNCVDCLYDAATLPDLIEASGRSWKSYQESMPAPCYEGPDSALYAMKHNPFMYFESIRLDVQRCEEHVVPFTQLYADIAAAQLPSFAFVTPNLCSSAHDCGLDIADEWLQSLMLVLVPALDASGGPYLVIVTWDEGQGDHSCCGLPEKAGGRVATILVSPQVRTGYEDTTPYSHYSVLKTVSAAWNLRLLGHAQDDSYAMIIAPWK